MTPPLRLAIGGSPYFGRRLATLLAGDGLHTRYVETRGWRPDRALPVLRLARAAGLIYLCGGQIAHGSRPHLLRLAVRCPIVMHWTGSDVPYARGVIARGRMAAALRDRCVHWAGAPWLVDELAELGITARWVPHSHVDVPAQTPPFPAAFTVLAYLLEQREEFYGAAAVRAVAEALPEARVLVAGVEDLADSPDNVDCLGWQNDMAPVYAAAHVLLRLPEHDGLSFMVQEALALGRYAIWNHSFPGVSTAFSADRAVALVAELAAHHRAGVLPFNDAGRAHVQEHFSQQHIRRMLREELFAVAGRGG